MMSNVEMLMITKGILESGVENYTAELKKLVEDLQDKVNTENAKANGNTNVLKVAKKIHKANIAPSLKGAINSDNNPHIQDDCEYYTDSHVALKSKKRLGLSVELSECTFNFNKIFNQPYDYETEDIELPTLAKLKNDIKAAKVKGKGECKYRIDNFYCDANYLVMAIEATGATVGTVAKTNSKYISSPMKLVGEDAEFVLLPIKPSDRLFETMENYTAIVV